MLVKSDIKSVMQRQFFSSESILLTSYEEPIWSKRSRSVVRAKCELFQLLVSLITILLQEVLFDHEASRDFLSQHP